MPLQIPKDELAAIAKIIRLPDVSVAKLVSAIGSHPHPIQPEDRAEKIAGQVLDIPIDDLQEILDVLYSLYNIRGFANVGPSRFLKDPMEGLQESDLAPLIGDEAARHRVRAVFQSLLSLPALNFISKAVQLQREGERLYCEARIISDVRPIFTDDVASRPAAAVITHTLKISYHEDGDDHKTFFVVLDSSDLEKMKVLIERALAKDKTLRTLLEETNLMELGL